MWCQDTKRARPAPGLLCVTIPAMLVHERGNLHDGVLEYTWHVCCFVSGFVFNCQWVFGFINKQSATVRLVPEIIGCDRLEDRKSTRLNSSHVAISYAVFCL